MLTEFIAQLLWVAVGDYYDEQWPLSDRQFESLATAQDDLGKIWGWP